MFSTAKEEAQSINSRQKRRKKGRAPAQIWLWWSLTGTPSSLPSPSRGLTAIAKKPHHSHAPDSALCLNKVSHPLVKSNSACSKPSHLYSLTNLDPILSTPSQTQIAQTRNLGVFFVSSTQVFNLQSSFIEQIFIGCLIKSGSGWWRDNDNQNIKLLCHEHRLLVGETNST